MGNETEHIRRRHKVKLETFIIVFKGVCAVAIGTFTPWGAALAQWIGSETWPPPIVWLGVILPASIVGGASQLQSFLSSAWHDYKQQKNADDTGQAQTVTVQPSGKA